MWRVPYRCGCFGRLCRLKLKAMASTSTMKPSELKEAKKQLRISIRSSLRKMEARQMDEESVEFTKIGFLMWFLRFQDLSQCDGDENISRFRTDWNLHVLLSSSRSEYVMDRGRSPKSR